MSAGVTRALFVPCRRGSARVPDKNTRPFAGHEGGLLGWKLDQLERTAGFDLVVVDSNDPVVLAYAARRRRTWRGSAALEARERPDALGAADTTTDALVAHALATIDADELAWTHVTSPHFGADAYARALAAWAARPRSEVGPGAAAPDSLVAVRALRAFVWSDDGPVNYVSRPGARWPRTQDVRPLYDVCSALFLVPMEVGRARGDRLGARPMRFQVSPIEAVDVDWPEDFALAEALATRYGEA